MLKGMKKSAMSLMVVALLSVPLAGSALAQDTKRAETSSPSKSWMSGTQARGAKPAANTSQSKTWMSNSSQSNASKPRDTSSQSKN